MNQNLFYLIYFTFLLAISLFLNRYFLARSHKYIVKKANDSAQRWASQSKPIFGGISFYACYLITVITVLIIDGHDFLSSEAFFGLFTVITIAFFMGLADDMFNTSPYFKFIVQFLVAFILINVGVYIDISPYLWLNYSITFLWVVGIMNSLNMLDNMDAITGTTSLIITIGVIVSLFLINDNVLSTAFILPALGLSASLLGFLYFNWNPSKMYMGDNGSQFLGAVLAGLAIVFYWNIGKSVNYDTNTKQLISVVLAFIVPISDTTTVTINRLMRGQSPFVGGRDHTTHHLSYLGLSDRGVAILLGSISIICVSISVYINYFLSEWTMTYFYLFSALALLIFISLYSITKISKPK